MRRIRVVAAAIALVSASGALAQGAVEGRWIGEAWLREARMPVELELRREGDRLGDGPFAGHHPRAGGAGPGWLGRSIDPGGWVDWPPWRGLHCAPKTSCRTTRRKVAAVVVEDLWLR